MIINHECFTKRKGTGKGRLKTCEDCIRFNVCKENKPLPIENFQGALRIGYSIIYDMCEDYEKAFKNGAKNKKNYCERWLRSEQPTILSAETYDGVALVEALEIKCSKKYGTFDEIYTKVQTKYNCKLKELLEQIKTATTQRERAKLSNKINKVRSILNG